MKIKLYLCICILFTLFIALPKADAQYTLTSHMIFPSCDSQTFRITSSNYTSTLRAETFFGDGASMTDTFMNGGPTATRSYFYHKYAAAGIYTVKHVLLLNGVPIDSVSYSDTVTICHYLRVLSYVDNNSDCTFDAGDTYLPNPYTIAIDSSGVPVDTITATSFYYNASRHAPNGTVYALRVITPPANFSVACPANGIIYDTIGTTTRYMTMGFVCDSTNFDLMIYAWFSPGITGACSRVYVKNNGCTPKTATVTINYSPKYAYAHALPASVTATPGAGSVTFNVGTIAPGKATYFNAYFTPVGTPVLGDTTHTTWTVTPITGDANPANNTLSRSDTIRSSYDPNEKSVTPQGNITAGTRLQYSISFENTGNDTAFNIHIQDTLSDNLDISTLELLSGSAAVSDEYSVDGAGHNVVKFDFENINLLDTSHAGQCNGMIVFTIKTKAGIPFGTVIDNHAGIYFDDNPVVMTNVVENIIGFPASVAIMSNNTKVEIYPNPVNEMLTVKVDKGIYTSINIINSIGQVMMQQPLNSLQTNIDVKPLTPGLYYIMLKGSSGMKVQKFQKL